MNLSEYKMMVNKTDAEDCPACSEDGEGPCLYHEGVKAGYHWVRRVIEHVLKDPEIVELP